jgi:hypothetical protein
MKPLPRFPVGRSLRRVMLVSAALLVLNGLCFVVLAILNRGVSPVVAYLTLGVGICGMGMWALASDDAK